MKMTEPERRMIDTVARMVVETRHAVSIDYVALAAGMSRRECASMLKRLYENDKLDRRSVDGKLYYRPIESNVPYPEGYDDRLLKTVTDMCMRAQAPVSVVAVAEKMNARQHSIYVSVAHLAAEGQLKQFDDPTLKMRMVCPNNAFFTAWQNEDCDKVRKPWKAKEPTPDEMKQPAFGGITQREIVAAKVRVGVGDRIMCALPESGRIRIREREVIAKTPNLVVLEGYLTWSWTDVALMFRREPYILRGEVR